MKYGYFDDTQREYVITNPRTPTKWINYIGGLEFGGFVDHTGGALLCKGDPALNRITKYLPQLPDASLKGTGLYLRVKNGDKYLVFSPFFVPTLDDYESYACHVGLGYTRIQSVMHQIKTEVTIFIPHGGEVELREIKVTNLGEDPLEIDVVPVVEYTHFDALKQFTNADWVPQTMVSRAETLSSNEVILSQYAFMMRDIRVNYFTANRPVTSFETDRQLFLGENGYRNWDRPLALEQAQLSNTQANRGDNIAALMIPLGVLQPNQTEQVITQLGQTEEIDNLQTVTEKYRDGAAVTKAFATLSEFWETYLEKAQVSTPDAAMNQMLNVHNPRQCYITKNWSRYLSLYQLGFGSRGIGFRDSSQDVLGIMGFVPEEGLDLIRMLLHVQTTNGSAKHQFNPLTMLANEGDSREDGDRPTFYSDDHLWIILSITEYLKETANFSFLEEEIPFYEKDAEGVALETGTVWEHMHRALSFTRQNVGRHGLPFAGFADWNDTINLPKGAESVFTACLYGKALLEIMQLADYLGKDDLAQEYQAWHTDMKTTVNDTAWDGDWYLRYYDEQGVPIGSAKNEQGQIFSNAQSWAVLAGYAENEQAFSALDAVRQRLNTAKGIKLSTPGYDGFDPQKGGVTTYPPGAKENGGIFLHANPWVMIAETMLGRGEYAFEYYNQINPASKNDIIDEFEVEPYVYPQNILGDEHPQFGLGRNSWLTGTASWTYQAGMKYILGIQPTYAGLRIDPCIPSAWDGFKVERIFRGHRINIEVVNTAGVNRGVKHIKLNGETIQGTEIPMDQLQAQNTIEVQMG